MTPQCPTLCLEASPEPPPKPFIVTTCVLLLSPALEPVTEALATSSPRVASASVAGSSAGLSSDTLGRRLR